ncbi:carbohydrate sulfotransferase 15-like [Watersipora subatra]|uniref:carbohydrate sulfotransferase 15-like n=1 Tax=Watersipora subatra TaxID=2589382 RepID=UPI00355B3992
MLTYYECAVQHSNFSLLIEHWLHLSVMSKKNASLKLLGLAGLLLMVRYEFQRSHYKERIDNPTLTLIPDKVKPKIVYIDLSNCPKPHYLPGYKAQCWQECEPGETCQPAISSSDVNSTRRTLKCISNLNLVGVRKAGTSDIKQWFRHREDVSIRHADFRIKDSVCPVKFFSDCNNIWVCDQPELDSRVFNAAAHRSYLQSSPGNLLINNKVARNSTHITITTAMQYLGFMSTPETKFFVQLRNPSDRSISYLFEFHKPKGGNIFSNMSVRQMDAKFVDGVIRMYLSKLKRCIAEHGDFYCAYLSDGMDGDLNCLLQHSMYVVYIKEAFKFIPRKQFLFTTTEEYSENEPKLIRKIMEEFYELPFREDARNDNPKVRNPGKKSSIWPSTLKLLDRFYEPYNKELAELLGDQKWLFQKDRDA